MCRYTILLLTGILSCFQISTSQVCVARNIMEHASGWHSHGSWKNCPHLLNWHPPVSPTPQAITISFCAQHYPHHTGTSRRSAAASRGHSWATRPCWQLLSSSGLLGCFLTALIWNSDPHHSSPVSIPAPATRPLSSSVDSPSQKHFPSCCWSSLHMLFPLHPSLLLQPPVLQDSA